MLPAVAQADDSSSASPPPPDDVAIVIDRSSMDVSHAGYTGPTSLSCSSVTDLGDGLCADSNMLIATGSTQKVRVAVTGAIPRNLQPSAAIPHAHPPAAGLRRRGVHGPVLRERARGVVGRGHRRVPLRHQGVVRALVALRRLVAAPHLRRGRRRPVLRRRRAVRRRAGARALHRRRPPRLAHRLPAERRRRRRRGPRRRLRRRRDACVAAERAAVPRRGRRLRGGRGSAARERGVGVRRALRPLCRGGPPLPGVRLGVVGHLARPPPRSGAAARPPRGRRQPERGGRRHGRPAVAHGRRHPERQDLGHAQPRHLAHPRGRPASQNGEGHARARRRLRRRVHVGRRRRLRALLRRDGHGALRGHRPG